VCEGKTARGGAWGVCFLHTLTPLSRTILSHCKTLLLFYPPFLLLLCMCSRGPPFSSPLFFCVGGDPCRPAHTQQLHFIPSFAGGRPPSPLPLLGRPSGTPTPCTRSRLCALVGRREHGASLRELRMRGRERGKALAFPPFDGPSQSDVRFFVRTRLCEGRRKGLVRRGRRRSRGKGVGKEQRFFPPPLLTAKLGLHRHTFVDLVCPTKRPRSPFFCSCEQEGDEPHSTGSLLPILERG
jgi:hypothetical protein